MALLQLAEKESFGSKTTSFWMCSTSLESLRDGECRSEQQRIKRRERKMVRGGEGFGKKRGEQRRAFALEQ